jgi:phosphoribosylformimino-5-aminoimidazole carboxamide ribotide isomerase
MFRPCIDLHEGKVKQIVGGTLGDSGLRTNFVSDHPAAWFAGLYKRDGLAGGHVIMLGPGNEIEARKALAAFPGGLQIGGGINVENARGWLDAGASHVIVTSWVFREGRMDWERLGELVKTVGKNRLVLDLSCRKQVQSLPVFAALRRGRKSKVQSPKSTRLRCASPRQEVQNPKLLQTDYFVVTDRWQKFTELAITSETLRKLAESCAEFLVHAADVEGLCRGIDRELVEKLGCWTPIPTTYAGGANSLRNLEEVTRLGQGKVDLTIGSALDIFGGKGVKYDAVVKFNRRQMKKSSGGSISGN